MRDWERKGQLEAQANYERTAHRLTKEKELDQFLTKRHVDKIKGKNKFHSGEVEFGIEDFIENMQRQGIEDGANIEALDQPPKEHRPLSGFSYPATMNKIKEKKRKQDFARKEKDIRQRKAKVDQRKTEQQVAYKNREEELLARFGESKEENDASYQIWRKEQCKEIEIENRAMKSEQMKSEFDSKIQTLEEENEKTRPEREEQY